MAPEAMDLNACTCLIFGAVGMKKLMLYISAYLAAMIWTIIIMSCRLDDNNMVIIIMVIDVHPVYLWIDLWRTFWFGISVLARSHTTETKEIMLCNGSLNNKFSWPHNILLCMHELRPYTYRAAIINAR